MNFRGCADTLQPYRLTYTRQFKRSGAVLQLASALLDMWTLLLEAIAFRQCRAEELWGYDELKLLIIKPLVTANGHDRRAMQASSLQRGLF